MAVRKEEVVGEVAAAPVITRQIGVPDADGVLWVPLNRLKDSPRNVRTVPHPESHIKALAAMIDADGQLYPLVVEAEVAESGQPTGNYLVSAGKGRRLAQLERVKQGRIPPDEPIWCKLGAADRARELSLADNQHEPMHPADEFDAFRKMIEEGRSIEFVAAYYGIKPIDVRRRLKLANVAPEFFEMFRRNALDIEHMMAFALTDDHEHQRAAWKSVPKPRGTAPHAEDLRHALTEDELPLNSSLVKFVGVQAYEKANGAVRRDLFGEGDDHGYIMDVPLLTKLATEKLNKAVAKLKEEGASWAESRLRLDYSELQTFGRVATILREYTEGEAAKLAAIVQERESLEAEAKALKRDDERFAAINQRLQALRAEAGAIARARELPDPEQQKISGAIASIENGKLRIERGLLLPADKKRMERQAKTAKRAADPKNAKADRTHSSALMLELTAHRTLALQALVAERPDVALVAITHRLILETFAGFSRGESAVEISAEHKELDRFAKDIKKSKAFKVLTERQAALKAQLPRKPEALFGWLLKQPQAEVLALLAYCVAVTLDGVRNHDNEDAADAVAKAAGLDMREWWKAGAANYFSRIPKERLIQIVSEAVSPEAASALRVLKKGSAAELAEERMADTGWLPSVLRVAKA